MTDAPPPATESQGPAEPTPVPPEPHVPAQPVIPDPNAVPAEMTEAEVCLAQVGLPGHPGLHVLEQMAEDDPARANMQPFDTSNKPVEG